MKEEVQSDSYRNMLVAMKRAFKTNSYGEHKMHQAITYKGIKKAAKEVNAIYV